MNIIELAKEAGIEVWEADYFLQGQLERFAALVRADRKWVDLTDEELLAALVAVDASTARLPAGFKLFARAVVAAFKEKNK